MAPARLFESHTVELPPEAWRMIEDLRKTGLYGDTHHEVILSLIRPALLHAARAGFTKLAGK